MQPTFSRLPPLSLYIHIPWCIRKCPYCDFNSHAIHTDLPEQQYIEALLADLERDLHYVQNRQLISLFFGGGTPSLFSAEGIDQILQGIAQRIEFSNTVEITLEANPGTFEQEKFKGYREAGVNRLSIGIQSFRDSHLRRLGRVHSSDEAKSAVSCAKTAGFSDINLDLMYGLPEQTPEQAEQDLRCALELNPTHLSWYQLTIEPNTEFHKHPPALPNDLLLQKIEQRGQKLLADHGYQQYEVSAYCLEARESRHNRNYWQFGDYLGIGAGAHAKITLLKQQQIVRMRKTRLPKDYLNSLHNSEPPPEVIPPASIPGEFMMNALRLNQGFTQDLFEQTTGLPFDRIREKVEQADADGLIEFNHQIRASNKGRLFLNDLLERFI